MELFDEQADQIRTTIGIFEQRPPNNSSPPPRQPRGTEAFHVTVETITTWRDEIAIFFNYLRSLRPTRRWSDCFNIPACAVLRAVFDALDGIDALTDQFWQIM